jgi:hypothetical protein
LGGLRSVWQNAGVLPSGAIGWLVFQPDFHAVAIAFDDNALAMMEGAVEHGGGDGGIAVDRKLLFLLAAFSATTGSDILTCPPILKER